MHNTLKKRARDDGHTANIDEYVSQRKPIQRTLAIRDGF